MNHPSGRRIAQVHLTALVALAFYFSNVLAASPAAFASANFATEQELQALEAQLAEALSSVDIGTLGPI